MSRLLRAQARPLAGARGLARGLATAAAPVARQLSPAVLGLLHRHGLSGPAAAGIPATGPRGHLLKADVLLYLGLIAALPPPVSSVASWELFSRSERQLDVTEVARAAAAWAGPAGGADQAAAALLLQAVAQTLTLVPELGLGSNIVSAAAAPRGLAALPVRDAATLSVAALARQLARTNSATLRPLNGAVSPQSPGLVVLDAARVGRSVDVGSVAAPALFIGTPASDLTAASVAAAERDLLGGVSTPFTAGFAPVAPSAPTVDGEALLFSVPPPRAFYNNAAPGARVSVRIELRLPDALQPLSTPFYAALQRSVASVARAALDAQPL